MIKIDQKELKRIRKEFETLQLKASQQRETQTPEDRLRTAFAMRKWEAVAFKEQDAIMEKVHDPKKYPEFTRDKITSNRIINGQVEGAEVIRQLILGTLTAGELTDAKKTEYLKKFAYNPEKHRDILSDHYLARTIIEFRNLPRVIADINGAPLDIQALENQIAQHENLIQTVANTPSARAYQEQQIQILSQQLLRAVLPELNGSAFEMGDFINHVIQDRLFLDLIVLSIVQIQ